MVYTDVSSSNTELPPALGAHGGVEAVLDGAHAARRSPFQAALLLLLELLGIGRTLRVDGPDVASVVHGI